MDIRSLALTLASSSSLLVDGQPKLCNLRDLLQIFLGFVDAGDIRVNLAREDNLEVLEVKIDRRSRCSCSTALVDETGGAASDEASSYYRTALLWIVPAKVAGVWKSANGDLTLKQEFQKISGSAF